MHVVCTLYYIMYHSSFTERNNMHAKYIFYIVLPSRMQFIAYYVCLLYCLRQRISPSFDFPFSVSPMHLFEFIIPMQFKEKKKE